VDVLVATGIFAPDIGGPATHSGLVITELRRRNWRAYLVTYGPAGVSRRIPRGVRHAVYLLQCLVRARRADLVYAQDAVSAGLPALLAAKLLRRTFVVRVPGDYAWEQAVQRFGVTDLIDAFQSRRYDVRTELLRRVQRWVVSNADAVITPSEYARRMVSGWTRRADRVRVVYGGSRFEEETAPPPALDDGVVIVTAGRLVSWKGIASLIELVAEHPGWRLVVIGGGPQAAELGARARMLKAPVSFTGALPQAELSRQVRRATVFALNTSFENFPHMLLEAMHGGVPVVATTIGGIPELIEDGKEGILVRPDDKRALGAAINRIVSDRDFRDVIVTNARAKARQFSVDRMLDGVMEVCQAALERRRGVLTTRITPDTPSSAPR
jgi:glycosyltransferase involved in cell wall biosynthesis